MAGLNGFDPSPPYSCLATTMAEITAMAETHQGANCGSDKPSSRPVTAAVLSLRKNEMGFPRSFRIAASDARARAIHQTTLIRLPQPKNSVWAIRPGMAARITQSITRDVGRAFRAWGDDC